MQSDFSSWWVDLVFYWFKGWARIGKRTCFCLVISGLCHWLGKTLHAQLLVSIVDSISACHAEDLGSIPRRGELVIFCCRTTHPKFHQMSQKRVPHWLLPEPNEMRWPGIEPGSTAWRQLCSPLYHQHIWWLLSCTDSKNAQTRSTWVADWPTGAEAIFLWGPTL